jgi:hypothetical protein
MQKKIKIKTEKYIHKKSDTRSDLNFLFPGNSAIKRGLLRLIVVSKFTWICKRTNPPSLSRDPSSLKFENPRYRIRGTMCNARIQSSKVREILLKNQVASNLRDHQENTSNLIY